MSYDHPFYDFVMGTPGLSVATTSVDRLLRWGQANSLWVFPMATSCCGIELMAAAASRVDLDRMGTIVRATPRQADVMVVAGTITVKMAPRVKKLWDQMPEPKWCVAMGSCATSGDFYRDLYPTVPGIDTFLPVDVYIPGCPPGPEALMHGLLRLQEKIRQRGGRAPEARPALLGQTRPAIGRLGDPDRDPGTTEAQLAAVLAMDAGPAVERPQGPLTPALALADRGEGDGDFAALLRERFGVAEVPKDGPPFVEAGRHRELARALVGMGYRQLVFVVASHRQDRPADWFEIAYGLRTVGRGSRLASWRVRVAEGETVDSLFPVLAGADWQEREQYDMTGVTFAGHPDLRRLLLPDDWTGFPLRRDYASDTRCAPWR
jgi:NADH-quinone oxidoreductase subunit B/C/D